MLLLSPAPALVIAKRKVLFESVFRMRGCAPGTGLSRAFFSGNNRGCYCSRARKGSYKCGNQAGQFIESVLTANLARSFKTPPQFMRSVRIRHIEAAKLCQLTTRSRHN